MKSVLSKSIKSRISCASLGKLACEIDVAKDTYESVAFKAILRADDFEAIT